MINILIIREKKIKTTVRYQLTPIRIAIIKKQKTKTKETTSKNAGEYVEKRNPLALSVDM